MFRPRNGNWDDPREVLETLATIGRIGIEANGKPDRLRVRVSRERAFEIAAEQAYQTTDTLAQGDQLTEDIEQITYGISMVRQGWHSGQKTNALERF